MQPLIESATGAAPHAQVMEVLNGIIDPCSAATAIPAGLVDMGLIRGLTFEPLAADAWHCSVKLCVTHAFCMMTGIFMNEIEKRLKGTSRVMEVTVELDCSTIWTEEFMSAEYRARLQSLRERRQLE